jgi:hypothetical protein
VVVEQDTIPEAESADLLVGRITSLVDPASLAAAKVAVAYLPAP